MSEGNETENNEAGKKDGVAAQVVFILGIVMAIGAAGWLMVNLDEAFGPFFDREDPVATEIPPTPEGALEAVLYAECQDQLVDALDGIAPPIPAEVIAANAEYLNEARKAIVRLEDLNERGRVMFDELKARSDDTPEEYRDEWNERAQEFRDDLYRSVVDVRRLGMSDPYTRLQSEIFLAYHWLDRYSDQINTVFTDQHLGGVSDEGVNMAALHLETASDLLRTSR